MPKAPPSPRRRGRPPVYRVPVTDTRIVKKYGNRRLYDTRESRYVNLEQLVDLFASEEGLKVLDAASGADLTERTLRQALLSEGSQSQGRGKTGGSLVPPRLLRAIIRYRRGAARTDFERCLTRAVANFEAARSDSR